MQTQTPLAQTFNDTAAAAYKVFPEQLKNLVLLLTPSSDMPVYVSPEIADQLTKSTAAIKEAVEGVSRGMRSRSAVGTANKNFTLAGTPVNLIALDNETARGAFSERYTKDMRIIFNLDHEIGHHILKNGYPSFSVSRQLGESAADAFGMLRHIQRFGKSTDQAGGYGDNRAFAIVLLADTDHYTSDTVQRVIEVANERDISGLSLKETAALADKISTECEVDEYTLEKIRDAYLPVNQACLKQLGSAWEISKKLYDEDKEAYALFCQETLSVMKANRKDADIFNAGKRFLSYPPIKEFMSEGAKTDPYWQEALRLMDNPKAKTKTKAPHSAAHKGGGFKSLRKVVTWKHH